MNIPDHLESFRLSAQALGMLLDEAEARQGRLPAAAFNWQHAGLQRSAVLDPASHGAELLRWADGCAELSIQPLLLLSGNEPDLGEALLEEVAEAGIDVVWLTQDTVDHAGRDTLRAAPLAQRLMLPDESVGLRYFMLALGHSFPVWSACASLPFWIHYGSALDRWRAAAPPRWSGLPPQRVFAAGAGRPATVSLPEDASRHHSDRAALLEALGAVATDLRLRAVEICRDLPFLRDEHWRGEPEPRRIGRMPGLGVAFHVSRQHAFGLWLQRRREELLGCLVLRPRLLEAGFTAPPAALSLVVLADSHGEYPAGHTIGAAVFAPGSLSLTLSGLALAGERTQVVASLDALRAGSTALQASTWVDSAHEAYLGRVDVELVFSGGFDVQAADVPDALPVRLQIGPRRIECEVPWA